jgi:predicted nucleic-acid-binding protein
MIGLDTNVLARYIVQDNPAQAALATEWIEGCCTQNTPAFINSIVLCEMVWVLKSAYGYDKLAIVQVLRQILATEVFMVEGGLAAQAAVPDYDTGPADFSDYLLARRNKAAGCAFTLTFDQAAGRHDLFKLL